MKLIEKAKENRRSRILFVALQLFNSKGYFNTSVHEIREKAEVSIGLVYRYFGNKEEIASALYQELLADVSSTLEEIIASHTTVHDRCRAIIAYFFELTEEYPEIVDYIFFARHQEFLTSTTKGPIPMAGPNKIIFSMIQEGINTGIIRKMHPPIVGAILFGSATKMIQQRMAGILAEPLPKYLDEFWECAWPAVAK
jgi:AcrR family transcriptional regulator